MGRAAMRRLLEQVPAGDYAAPVELVERASLQAPGGVAAPAGNAGATPG
jgi:hypothetical protein